MTPEELQEKLAAVRAKRGTPEPLFDLWRLINATEDAVKRQLTFRELEMAGQLHAGGVIYDHALDLMVRRAPEAEEPQELGYVPHGKEARAIPKVKS